MTDKKLEFNETLRPVSLNLSGIQKPIVVSGSNIIDPIEERRDYDRNSYDPIYRHTEINNGSEEQFIKVKTAIKDLLSAFNVNWEDPNYTNTPQRVARAYIDYWVSGYAQEPKDVVTVFPNTSGTDDMVMVKDMKFYSMCSHHLAPIAGYGAIAYIPDEKLLGLSKLGRILNIYAKRFQLQERIGAQVADAIMELIEPKGVMVVLYNVEHMCMSSRGVQLHEAVTTTSAVRGFFRDHVVRQEAMALLSK